MNDAEKKYLENVIQQAKKADLPEGIELRISSNREHLIFKDKFGDCWICLWPLRSMQVIQLQPPLGRNATVGDGWIIDQVVDYIKKLLDHE